jgi:hypothetical protein
MGKRKGTMIERIMAKIRRVNRGAPDGLDCWEFTGCLDSQGYGRISGTYHRSVERTHIAMYLHHHGPIPKGHVVRHKCDNRPCCAPHHLESGTQADNVRDMFERGRARGFSAPKPFGSVYSEDHIEPPPF